MRTLTGKVSIKLMACPGATLGSGLLADPCQSCKRRADHGDMLPVVRWVEAPDFAGYECANQVKPAKPRHRSEVWGRLAEAMNVGVPSALAPSRELGPPDAALTSYQG